MTLRAELTEMKGKINSMHTALIGNIDDPETVRESILAQVLDHRKHVRFWRKFGWAVILSLLTIPPAIVTGVFFMMIHTNRVGQ